MNLLQQVLEQNGDFSRETFNITQFPKLFEEMGGVY